MMQHDAASPRGRFGAPGFLVAAVAVAGLVILTLVMIFNGPQEESENAEPAAPSAAPPTPTDAETAVVHESVCGLEGTDLEGRLTGPPEVDTWDFQGTVPYPVSERYGPGARTDQGVRYCFQHSPEGALFAAANALAQASDPTTAQDWARTFLSAGPARERWIADAGNTTDQEGVRLAVAGFRLLSYTGSAARVDLGVAGSAAGSAVHGTFVYELVWHDGDWKLDAEAQQPMGYATVPDLAGYVTWGATS